jgi:hypothetical protein
VVRKLIAARVNELSSITHLHRLRVMLHQWSIGSRRRFHMDEWADLRLEVHEKKLTLRQYRSM